TPSTVAKIETSTTTKVITIGSHKLDNSFDAFKINEVTRDSKIGNKEIENRYFIVVGSCRSAKDAGKFAGRIERKGYLPTLLDPNKGRFRIAIEGFVQKKEAMAELKSYRNSGFPDAWIWTKK
ncbi:SPOR domain-containing protein, partial [Candidatus Venteria ishoeyi]|uniref:SPOR domain-containing protein n=1 Tax=Candidatus Venteria ishoeyi TaxID=1899563 RepID=UPI0015A88B00